MARNSKSLWEGKQPTESWPVWWEHAFELQETWTTCGTLWGTWSLMVKFKWNRHQARLVPVQCRYQTGKIWLSWVWFSGTCTQQRSWVCLWLDGGEIGGDRKNWSMLWVQKHTVMDKNNENHVFWLSFLNRQSLAFLYYTWLDRNDIIHILEKRWSESVKFSQS